jgi:serine carboxypeptidase
LIGFFQETGPCEVVQLPDGSYGTQARLWGWDRSSNMLFIDQPVQTGLSYDVLRVSLILESRLICSCLILQNFSYDFLHEYYGPPDAPLPLGLPPFLFTLGTFSSQEQLSTANTTVRYFLRLMLALA